MTARARADTVRHAACSMQHAACSSGMPTCFGGEGPQSQRAAQVEPASSHHRYLSTHDCQNGSAGLHRAVTVWRACRLPAAAEAREHHCLYSPFAPKPGDASKPTPRAFEALPFLLVGENPGKTRATALEAGSEAGRAGAPGLLLRGRCTGCICNHRTLIKCLPVRQNKLLITDGKPSVQVGSSVEVATPPHLLCLSHYLLTSSSGSHLFFFMQPSNHYRHPHTHTPGAGLAVTYLSHPIL